MKAQLGRAGIMPEFDSSSIVTYTDADLLLLWRAAYAACSMGQSYSISGRQLTRANLPEIVKQITWLETRTNADGHGLGRGPAFAQFRESM